MAFEILSLNSLDTSRSESGSGSPDTRMSKSLAHTDRSAPSQDMHMFGVGTWLLSWFLKKTLRLLNEPHGNACTGWHWERLLGDFLVNVSLAVTHPWTLFSRAHPTLRHQNEAWCSKLRTTQSHDTQWGGSTEPLTPQRAWKRESSQVGAYLPRKAYSILCIFF